MSYSTSIKSLILVGGKSARMGKEKALLDFHGQPQVDYIFQLSKNCGLDTFVSCSADQIDLFKSKFPIIVDGYEAIGPIGGILSAFSKDATCDWLVIACDMPNIDQAHIDKLLKCHKANQITAYKGNLKSFPESTFTIYPSSILPSIKLAVSQNDYRLQNLLGTNKLCLITPENEEVLVNVNLPTSYLEFRRKDKRQDDK